MNETNASIAVVGAAEASTQQGDHLPSPSVELRDRILVTCPGCSAILKVRRIYIGSAVRCKRCNQKFLVPSTVGTHAMPIYDGTWCIPTSKLQPAIVTRDNCSKGTTNSPLLTQLIEFVTAGDELRSAYEELQSTHAELCADRDAAWMRLEKADLELRSIRAHLGSFAPSDVRRLASERESLLAEVLGLRDERQSLLAARAYGDTLTAELEQKVLELGPIQVERDALASEVNRQRDELSAARASHDALADELRKEGAALVAAHSDLDRLKEKLQQTEDELQSAREEEMQARRKLDLCENELISVRTDLGRSNSAQQTAQEAIDRLAATAIERDVAIANQRDRFNAELASIKAALFGAEQRESQESERLTTELAALVARYQQKCDEHEATKSLCVDLEARNCELVGMQERLTAEHHERSVNAQAEHQKLVDQVLETSAYAEKTGQVRDGLISGGWIQPSLSQPSADELEFARIQAEGLKSELAHAKCACRVMAETLDKLGVQIQLPTNHQG
jgi:chromosome segregation ATPase